MAGRPAQARRGGLDSWRLGVLGAMSCVSLAALSVSPAVAQLNFNQRMEQRHQNAGQKGKMLVEANQLIYDNDNNRISASGNAQIYYDNKSLEADRIIYDRTTKRVFAEGNVRMTDESGTITHGDRFELTDNFRDGFIDSLRVESTTVVRGETLKIRFAAPRAERAAGEQTTFEHGTYTACEPCAEHPERPPFWQVRATKIIHNNEERTIYYENATIELYGYPVAWVPYFWSPDNTVKRKTGILAPHFIRSTTLGNGGSLPFFWNIAPNYDLTFTPTYLSRQGFLGQVEWRHRLVNGSYAIRAGGIFQRDPSAFLKGAFGPGDRTFRGSLETNGTFYLNQQWRLGWDVTLQTDKWFLDHYRLQSQSLQLLYYRDSISQIYLRGKGDRSFFDLRGYYFQPLTALDWQKQQPVVGVLDYNKRRNLPGPIGGEIGFDLNVTALTREQTQFGYLYRPKAVDRLGNPVNPLSYPLLFPDSSMPYNATANSPLPYEGCVKYVRGTPDGKGDCIIRGLAGNQTRATATIDWRRQIIDPIGQVFTPFASLRLDGVWFSPRYDTAAGNANTFARQYVEGIAPGSTSSSTTVYARAMPAIGLQYRFPFVSTASWGTQVIEPVAEIVARPNETRVGALPNNDAQSLVFDDTTLMSTDKFSGYDRVEGGVRANVGLQYTFQGPNGGYANFLVGQSYQVAGKNSYTLPDLNNTGLNSGLDKRSSDIVARAILSTGANFTINSRARFSSKNFSLQRLEVGPTFNYGKFSGSLLYARYAAQPELGYAFRREGLALGANYKVNTNWSVFSSAVVDLDRYLQAREAVAQGIPNVTGANERFTLSSVALGAQYKDECTIFSVQYVVSGFRDAYNGVTTPSRAIFVKLELRSLGEVNVKQDIGALLRDGLAPSQ